MEEERERWRGRYREGYLTRCRLKRWREKEGMKEGGKEGGKDLGKGMER